MPRKKERSVKLWIQIQAKLKEDSADYIFIIPNVNKLLAQNKIYLGVKNGKN